MPKFTTRVELHSATDTDYERLHAAMEGEGFTRTISSESGTYRLPTAEYNRDGQIDTDEVLESAKRAAGRTGKKFAVLVTESNGRTWVGLEIA